MTLIKTDNEIAKLREQGKVLGTILQQVAARVRPGITTAELNEQVEKLIVAAGGRPAFKGYGSPVPFPAGLCASVNEEIVHGIPGKRALVRGDIISLDIGMEKDGLYTDTAITVPVGEVTIATQRLLNITAEALTAGIAACVAGNTIGDIGAAVQAIVKRDKMSVVRDLVGHGVGHAVHEEPSVPNQGRSGQGMLLEPGMVLAVEPMVALGRGEIDYLDDDWTIVTADGSLSAHFEHTIAITNGQPIIITAP
ncbi:MAG: type I methionyl aminopeptidase [Candidatus Komeilibacteria bacterium]|nr:type I methionyl aminopeptidase [Candidatus Komeilibacteria bacterium]